ncbi:MAG: D-TA family PLP-dependent enzyme [Chthoniobacter sp.]|nr:D-TA family PLP-dependent enzyme [Chthoniobacter sp.]
MDWFRLTNEAEVASPALLLFEERIDSNLRRMIEIAGSPERLRPHVKTHKLGPLVAKQLALGINKFKSATIAEAEMCAQAGAPDVLLAMPPVGPNAQRLCALAKKYPGTRFSTLIDDAGAMRALGAVAVEAGLTLDVFLDLDCGQNRTGIRPGVEALELYRLATTTPGLHVAGLHAYDGHIHEADLAKRRALYEAAFAPVIAFRQQLESAGLPVPMLVAGGTPTFPFHAQQTDRECSPGTTVLWDFGYADKHVDLPFLPAALLLTRVVSKPGANRLCLDLGHKAVAAENPHPRVRFLELPDAPAVSQSEEHLVIETPRAAEFSVGDTLHGIPRHVCPTVALYSEATVVRGGAAVETWPILARARRLTI